MNIEDITKAAAECRLTTAQSMGVYGQYRYIDECPNHGLSCDELVEDSFVKGAEWRINIVWHNTREKPDKGKMLIVEDIDSAYDLVYLTKSKPWEELSEKNHYTRWAYIDDLLPNMEE